MSEMHTNHDDLEQRLRAQFHRQFAPPPAPTQIWHLAARGLREQAQGDHLMASVHESHPVTTSVSSPNPAQAVIRHRSGYVTRTVSIAAVIVLALFAGVIFASHSHRSLPTAAATVKPSQTGNAGQTVQVATDTVDDLTDISMISSTEGWAVGSSTKQDPNKGPYLSKALLYHYLNGVWHTVTLPLHFNTNYQYSPSLRGIAMLNSHDGWAVGYADGGGLILHYDGTSWTRVPCPVQVGLGTIQMISPDEGWITSSDISSTPQDPTILHYSNGKWKVQYRYPSNNGGAFTGLSMVSSEEGWATLYDVVFSNGMQSGSVGEPKGLILHYQAGQWQVQYAENKFMMSAISMLSATDGWAAGTRYEESTINKVTHVNPLPVRFHYQDGQWHVAADVLPTPTIQGFIIEISELHTSNTGDAWLCCGYAGAGSSFIFLYHYDGTSWLLVQIPIQDNGSATINKFAFLPDGEGWAVGNMALPNGPKGVATSAELILHYVNGTWNIQLS